MCAWAQDFLKVISVQWNTNSLIQNFRIVQFIYLFIYFKFQISWDAVEDIDFGDVEFDLSQITLESAGGKVIFLLFI